MITPETDPWAVEDAANAAGYARWHTDARAAWEANKTPDLANAMVSAWEVRDAHQKNTGWSAEPLGQGWWRFTYMDPKTRFTGGTAVIITTEENPNGTDN